MLTVPNQKDEMMTTDNSCAEQRLMNKAVHYLGRYSASRQRLREILRNTGVASDLVEAALGADDPGDDEEILTTRPWVEELV